VIGPGLGISCGLKGGAAPAVIHDLPLARVKRQGSRQQYLLSVKGLDRVDRCRTVMLTEDVRSNLKDMVVKPGRYTTRASPAPRLQAIPGLAWKEAIHSD
jgi:hypothetical protein